MDGYCDEVMRALHALALHPMYLQPPAGGIGTFFVLSFALCRQGIRNTQARDTTCTHGYGWISYVRIQTADSNGNDAISNYLQSARAL